MSRHFVYNLSNIPDFNNAVKSGEINADYSKYYSVQQYFTKSNQKYSVIKYIKDFLCIDLIPTYGVCRSIIVNSQNKVVSFAPPKSIPSDRFIQSYNISNDIVAEEFVEGTMINVFWDPTIGLNGGWEIATRNTPGATSSFFKGSPNKTNKTFREMFLEAAEQNNLLFNMLNPVYCYSFVLQHPENRIVVPFKNPQLYLVEMYLIEYIDNSIFVNSFEPRSLLKEIFEVSNVTVQFPEIYTCTSYPDLIEKYASMNTSYNIVGVVLHNRVTGERAKIRNPVYEQVRNLRGNQPKLQYQYLSLRKEGKVSDFLKFYPENKKHFSEFRDQVHLFTNTLFDNYKACYIKKEKPLKEFSEQYRTHMFHIHQLFLTDLIPENKFIIKQLIIST
jgi:hypothetical protein